jgi:hypothetical protein
MTNFIHFFFVKIHFWKCFAATKTTNNFFGHTESIFLQKGFFNRNIKIIIHRVLTA